MSYDVGLSLRSARTVLENTIVTAALTFFPLFFHCSTIHVRSGTVSVIVVCQYLDREVIGKRLGKVSCDIMALVAVATEACAVK